MDLVLPGFTSRPATVLIFLRVSLQGQRHVFKTMSMCSKANVSGMAISYEQVRAMFAQCFDHV